VNKNQIPFGTRGSIKRCAVRLVSVARITGGRPVVDVTEALGLTDRQGARLRELFGGLVPEEAERLLREVSVKNSPERACNIIDAALARIRCVEAGKDELDDWTDVDPGKDLNCREVHLPWPTLTQIARYFLDSYGPERLYFYIAPFDRRRRLVHESTFAEDNIEQLEPWLLLQTAKVASGGVDVITMVVRVFDMERTVDALGPTGRVRLPEKDLYMFRYSAGESVGFDEDTTLVLHCTNPQSGELEPPEPGVRFASGAGVVKSLRLRSI